MTIKYTEYLRYNTLFESYGQAKKINLSVVAHLYGILSFIIPVVVPVFLYPILLKTLSKKAYTLRW